MAVIENNTENQDLDFSGMVKNAKGEVIDFSSVVSTKPKSTKKTVATAVPVKKKDQSQPTESTTTVSKSVSQPTKSSLVLPSGSTEKPEEVGYVEDIWNRFKGSGTKILSEFLKIPSAAQSYIYDVALAATGKDEEFNRLPAAVKREVKDAVRNVNRAAPMGEFQFKTREAANYLDKKAEKIYQRTINDETSLSDEISKLATNPTSEGVLKIVNKSIRSTAESLPYMAISMLPGGAAAIGVSTAAGKREQELEDTGNYGMGFLVNSAVTGGTNYLGEKYTGRILNKIGAKALGNPELLKKVTQTPLVELGKDLGIEFTTGGLQSFTQEVSDKWTKGQEVQWIPTLKKALDDALLESASVGTFAAAGQGVSGTRKLTAPLKRYLATKIIAKEDASYIKKGVDAIQDLTTQKADDQDPIVNEAIDNKIEEIKTNITGKLQMAEDMVDNLSDEDIKKTIQIDRDLEDVRLKAKAIKDNPTLDDATKETLRKDLANKYINLNQQKNAIQEQAKNNKVNIPTQGPVSFEYTSESEIPAELKGIEPISKSEIDYGNGKKKIRLTFDAKQLTPIQDAIQEQATSKVPIQPEAGVSGEVAKGESQAEPQGVAEEVKVEEVKPLKPEDISFGTAFDIQNSTAEQTTGREKDTWGDAQVWRERIENSGDILRELSSRGERPDPGYLLEKVNKLRNWIKSNKKYPSEPIPDDIKTIDDFNKTNLRFTNTVDGYEYLNKFYSDVLEKTKKQYEEIPTYTKEQELALDLTIDLLNNDLNGLESKLDEIENIANKIKKEGKLEIIPSVKLSKSAQRDQQKPTKEVVVEEVKPIEYTPEQKAEQVTAVKKGIDAVNKAVERGRPLKKAVEGGIAFMQKTIAYEQADDVTREQMLRDINKKFGVREKKAPSAKKIVGQPTVTNVTVNEATALKDQIKLEAKAAKGGADFVKKITKSVGETLKSMVSKGSITPAQQKTIFNGLKTNLTNPTILNRFLKKVDRIMGVADYREKVRQANAIRTRLATVSKREGLKPELKDIAKALSKIQPNMVNNIDEFISRAKDALDATKPSNAEKESTLIDFKDYTNYTKKILDAQDKAAQEYKEQQYQDLKDQGLVSGDMSLKEIEDYLKKSEEDEKFQENLAKEKKLAEYAKASFADSKEVIEDMIDNDEISGEDLPLIKGFILIDTDVMNPKMAVKAADELRNYIHNGSKTGMGKIFKDYLGALNAKAMAEKTTVNKILSVGGVKNLVLKGIDAATGYVAGKFDLQGTNLSKWYSDAWLEYVSQIDNLGVTAMGEKNWLEFKKASGFDEIVEGFVRNKKEIDRFTKEFVKKYDNKKVDGKRVFTKYNATQAGIIADLYRETGDTPEEVAENFQKRKDILKEAIDYTKDKLRFRVEHKIMKELYDKLGIEKATSGQEVFNNAPKLMQDVVSDMVGEWSKYFPASQRVAEEQYGILLGQNKNYTPYRWTVVSDKISSSDPLYDKGGYVSDFDILDTEEVGTFKQITYPDKLPTINGEVIRIPNYNFFQNNIDALTQTGNNINTIAGVNQFNGFIKSKYLKDIIKDDDSRNLLVKRMTYNINKLTDREKISTSRTQRGILKVLNIFSGLGTRLGLGAITSPASQALPALTNTLFNLELNPTQMVRSISMLTNPANREWLDNLDETISERGKESTTSVDYAQKMLSNKTLITDNQVVDAIAAVTKFYVDTALVKSDVAAAKISWLSYYLTELEKKGVDVSNLKLSETQVDKEAAKIADRKVQREQNINIAELSGKLFSSKSTGLRLLRNSLLAFQSYTISSRDKMKTNMSILFNPNSLSTVEEKIEAIDSIAATIAEQKVFSYLKSGIRNLVIAGAYAAVGEEETEEERKLREKRNQENEDLNIFQSLTGSFGIGDQEWDLDIVNAILDAFQGTLDEQDAERRIQEQEEKDMMGDEEGDSESVTRLTPEEKKAERLQRSLDRPFRFYVPGVDDDDRIGKYSRYLGSAKVLVDVIDKVVLETNEDLNRGGYYDKRGNFIEYNDKQKEKLNFLRDVAPFQLIGVPPTEVKTLTNQMKKIMKDRAYMNKMIEKDEERRAKLDQ